MKKAFSILLALALLLSCCPVLTLPAQAATEGLYTYTVTAGAATITACDKSASGALTIPSTLGGYPVTKIGDQSFVSNQNITSVVIPEGVTGIYWQAFAYCPNLASVTLPQSLTTLGSGIFTYCTSLRSIDLPKGLQSLGDYVFQDCSALTSIVIPEGITEIPRGAFWCCYALQEVTLPASVTYIDNRAFDSCDLQTVYYGGTKLQWQTVAGSGKSALTSYIQYMGVSNDPEIVNKLFFELYDGQITITGSDDSISGDVVIPATISGYPVTRIEYCAFEGKSGITSVVLPDSITSVGWNAFADCINLKSVTFGSGVTLLSDGVFARCYRLETVVLPEGLTEIGYKAFNECCALTNITLPDSVTLISGNAFLNCTALKTIQLSSNLTSICYEAFRGCSALTEVTLPDSLVTVETFAFRGCRNLQTLSIGAGLADLGIGAFTDCGGLKTITVDPENPNFTTDAQGALMNKNGTQLLLIPQSKADSFVIPQTVTQIGYAVFADCWNLKEIAIPKTVTSIGSYAFANSNLTTIVLPEGLQTIGENAFCECDRLTELTIPGSVTTIGYNAFQRSGLKRVTLQEGIETIGYASFIDCSALTAVAIPSTVTAIYGSAFFDCNNLFYIYYGGNEAQWEQINISYENKPLENALIRYNATMPEVPEVPTVEDMLTYTIEDGCATITGCNAALSGEVTIPDTLGGCPVTAIADNAFEYCYNLTAVTLPDSVVSIGFRAFFSCSSLTSIQLGAGVAEIGKEAFNDSYSLLSINVSESNACFASDAQGVLLSKDGTRLVAAPGALEEYTVPDSVITIGESAFSGCRQLEKLTFGKNVTTLEDYALANCTCLTTVNISAGITSIAEDAFANCDNLYRFVVASENPQYSSDSRGVLFNKQKTVLLKAPNMLSGRYTAPGSVIQVGDGAFKYCYELTDVVFGNNLTQVSDMAFYGDWNLNSVTLPVSLQYVGWWAFKDCWPNTVYYTGTREQWEQVEIDSSGNDSLLYTNFVYEHVAYTPGDLDGVEGVNEDDVIYLLQYLLMPDDFAVDQAVDYDHNDTIDEDDVIYLLQHLLMPDDFPLV